MNDESDVDVPATASKDRNACRQTHVPNKSTSSRRSVPTSRRVPDDEEVNEQEIADQEDEGEDELEDEDDIYGGVDGAAGDVLADEVAFPLTCR